MNRFRMAALGACAAALVFTTTTFAGSGAGDVFNLGQTNSVNATSKLTGAVAGPQLTIENTSPDPAAAGLSISVPSGVPPLKVSSQKLVANLNADLLGGKRLGQLPYWNLRGNAGTSPPTNFIGTTDAKPLVFKTSGKEAMRIDASSQKLTVWGSGEFGAGGGFCSSDGIALAGCGASRGTGVYGDGYYRGVVGTVQGSACPADFGGVVGCSGISGGVITGPEIYNVGVRGGSGSGVGVSGLSNSGRAVEGITQNGIGVIGASTTRGVVGTLGYGSCPGTYAVGGCGGDGIGVAGASTNSVGVYGSSMNGSAGYFEGDVTVSGTLYAGKKQFRIDDPLDPAHKYLQHTSVESSDMLDIYTGNVTTDARGFATVRLPNWFQALNRSFRYQLTILGHAPWDTQARVWDEIAHNRFTIRTSRPGVRVSWQVTGIRHDPYANANRTQVIVPKAAVERGNYLYPGLYGKPRRFTIGFQSLHRGRKR